MKFKNWLRVMLKTRTISGPLYYFHVAYFALTFSTILSKAKLVNQKNCRARVERWFNREIEIKNELGRFSVNPKNDSLTKSITSFEHAHQSWLDAAEHRELFLDIGANIGFYSILALKRYGFKHVLAFEPNPPTYERLQRNITLNQLTASMQAFAVGIGDQNGSAALEARSSHTGASSFVHTHATEHESISVPTTTLDNFLAQHNIDPATIGFIKIDIEGYEYYALRGMSKTLEHLTLGTIIFIEVHPRSPQAEATHKLITQAGFTLRKQSPQHNFLYQKAVQ